MGTLMLSEISIFSVCCIRFFTQYVDVTYEDAQKLHDMKHRENNKLCKSTKTGGSHLLQLSIRTFLTEWLSLPPYFNM